MHLPRRALAATLAAAWLAACGADASTTDDAAATDEQGSAGTSASATAPDAGEERVDDPSAAASAEPSTAASTDPAELAPNVAEESDALVAQFPVGKRPCALEVDADGRVFVTSFDGAAVIEVDPATREEIGRIETGTEPCGIAVIDDQLWVAELGDNAVVRYDRDTGEELARVDVDADPWDLQAGPDRLWVAERQTGRVLGIDPATAEVVVTVEDPVLASGLEITDDGVVWVADEQGDEVLRIDGTNGEVLSRLEADSPRWFTRSPGAVWVSVVEDHQLLKLDETTGEVLASVDVGDNRVPLDLGYAAGWIWSPDTARGVVQMIDPDSAEIEGEIKLLTGAWVAEPVGDEVWVTNFNYRVRGHVYVLDPDDMPPPFTDR